MRIERSKSNSRKFFCRSPLLLLASHHLLVSQFLQHYWLLAASTLANSKRWLQGHMRYVTFAGLQICGACTAWWVYKFGLFFDCSKLLRQQIIAFEQSNNHWHHWSTLPRLRLYVVLKCAPANGYSPTLMGNGAHLGRPIVSSKYAAT